MTLVPATLPAASTKPSSSDSLSLYFVTSPYFASLNPSKSFLNLCKILALSWKNYLLLFASPEFERFGFISPVSYITVGREQLPAVQLLQRFMLLLGHHLLFLFLSRLPPCSMPAPPSTQALSLWAHHTFG